MLNFFSAEIMISSKINLKITLKIEILKSESLPHYFYNVSFFELALAIAQDTNEENVKERYNEKSNRYDISREKETGE